MQKIGVLLRWSKGSVILSKKESKKNNILKL
jgi:hypothetical protein